MAAPLSVDGPIRQGPIARLARQILQPGWLAVFVGIAAITTGVSTYLAMSGQGPFDNADPDIILGFLLATFVLGLILAILIVWRVISVIAARRSHSAGARLHSQMVIVFSLVAGAPMILVAVFSALALFAATELVFGPSVKSALGSSLKVVEVYVTGHKQTIERDMVQLMQGLSRVDARTLADRPRLLDVIRNQGSVLGLSSIYLITEEGRPILQADVRKGVSMDLPSADYLAGVEQGQIVVLTDSETDQVRAIARVPWQTGAILYIGRTIHPDVIRYQTETRDAVANYQRLEGNRFNIQVGVVAIYFVIAMILILVAMLLGLTVANRIAQPIGRLIGAAEKVSLGDLSARVDVGRTRDEIEVLGRAFNRMTGQIQSQRNELVEANRQFDERRRFTEAVLSGVSAGVISADEQGIATVANRSALKLLQLKSDEIVGQPIVAAVPEFASLLNSAKAVDRARAQIDVDRGDGDRRLNVQITKEDSDGGSLRYIITFDDITELAAAQRTAAWADVARRIAHEIKNPLTPIQLSAERLRRKYKKEIQTDPEIFDQCTDTIVRHVSDIGRMVDEFSAFARMPEPIIHETDLNDLLRQAAFSQRVALPGVRLNIQLPDKKVMVPCDGRLLAQVLTNVLKNASEAIAARQESEDGNEPEQGEIRIELTETTGHARIQISDNGGGWPRALKSRLTEPYVTTRKKGTGLGLAIVRKIVEDHGGQLTLADRLLDGTIVEEGSYKEEDLGGAALIMRLPFNRARASNEQNDSEFGTEDQGEARPIGIASGT